MKIFKDIRIYLIIILTLLCCYATYMFHKSVLPWKYLIMVILVFLFLIFTMAALCYQRNKFYRFTGIILSVLIILLGSVGVFSLDKAMDVISSITNHENTKINYVLICKDGNLKAEINKEDKESPYTDLSLYKDKVFGIIEIGDTTFNSTVVKKVREDIGNEVEVVSLKSIQESFDKFQSGEVEVLILNNSLKSMFDEDITNGTSTLAKYSYEIENDDIRKAAKVTKEPFLLYVTGIDTYGELNVQARSDVNKIIAVNPNSKKILLIDIPRDYYIPQTCQYGKHDKLTHTGFFGISCTTESIEKFLGIDINYYAKVNFTSLVDIVDAIGGITVFSEYEFDTHMAAAGYHFNYGENHLDGMEALMFSRERYAFEDGDNQRVKNQTIVLEAILKKVCSPEIISHYTDFMGVMGKTMETNLNEDEIYSLIQMQLSDMASWEMESFSLSGEGAILYSPLNGFDSWVMIPDEDLLAEAKLKLTEFMAKTY